MKLIILILAAATLSACETMQNQAMTPADYYMMGATFQGLNQAINAPAYSQPAYAPPTYYAPQQTMTHTNCYQNWVGGGISCDSMGY